MKQPRSSAQPRSSPSALLVALLIVSLAMSGFLAFQVYARAQRSAKPAEPPRELLPYAALGSFLAENNHVRDLQWSEEKFAAFIAGIRATYEGRGYPLDDEARALRDQINAHVQKNLATEKPDPTQDYFRMLRDRENVQATASGLHYRITHEGDGAPPRAADKVVVSFAARTPDGTALDALTAVRLTVGVTDLLPGLAEGVQLLKPGGKGLMYVPAPLSYGAGEWPKEVPRGMPIGFFVELHEVIPADAP